MSKRMKRWLVAPLAITGIAALLAACGGAGGSGGGAAAPAGQQATTLRVAATSLDSLPFMAILQVAEKKGWFSDQGLKVSFISGSGGGNTLRTVTTGDAELAITGGPAVVKAAQNPSSNMKIVGSWFQVNDFYWIGPKIPASKANLKLGTTGAGSTTQLLGSQVAAKLGNGVSIVQVGEGMGDAWAAAKSGSIDAGWAMHPFVTDKVKNDGGQIVVAARDVVGDFPADLVAANAEFATKNPDTIKKFFAAADKAMKYVVQDPDGAAADLSPILKIDPALVAQGLKETPEPATAYSLKVDTKALTTLSDIMVSTKQIDAPVDWSTLLDQQYLPQDAQAKF
jgi:NitT/TauT family transport system substrate-binding protein